MQNMLLLFVLATVMVSQMSKQGTAGKQKHWTLIPQKLEIIRSWIVNHDINKQKDQLQLFMASGKSVEDLFKREPLKELKVVQV
jgi:hypothetical protein